MSEFSVSPPRGGGVANATEIQGVPVSDVAPTETQVLAFDGTEYVPTGPAAGVVASLSGAGITDSPGILDQAGGMSIDDSEGDGFSVTTNGGITLSDDSDGGVVIDDENGGRGHDRNGKVKWKAAPAPGSDSTQSWPPWASSRAM